MRLLQRMADRVCPPSILKSRRTRCVSFASNSAPTESNSTRWFTKADSSGFGISFGGGKAKSGEESPPSPSIYSRARILVGTPNDLGQIRCVFGPPRSRPWHCIIRYTDCESSRAPPQGDDQTQRIFCRVYGEINWKAGLPFAWLPSASLEKKPAPAVSPLGGVMEPRPSFSGNSFCDVLSRTGATEKGSTPLES
jgi:hypothetical protein